MSSHLIDGQIVDVWCEDGRHGSVGKGDECSRVGRVVEIGLRGPQLSIEAGERGKCDQSQCMTRRKDEYDDLPMKFQLPLANRYF